MRPPGSPFARSTRRSLLATTALAGLVATAACGTTVPLASQSALGSGDGLSSADPDGLVASAEGPAPGGAAATGPDAGGTTGTGGRGGTGGASTTAPGGGGPGRASSPLATGPRTTSPVKVGFYVSEDVGKALAAFGLDGLSSGDGPTQAKVATALLNGSGGLDGRRVEPVVFTARATTNDSEKRTQEQAACELFFTDNAVAAVVSVLPVEVVSACSAKKGVPLSVSSISTLAREQMRQFPNVAMPNQIERDHGVSVIVPSLERYGYFTPRRPGEEVRIGLVTNGARGFEQLPALVEAELRELGRELTDTATVSTADKASGEAASAVLRFQSQRITHVVVIDDHGGPLTFFALAAGPQGYYPRLGLSSYSIPQVAADVLAPEHFAGATGVGWLPTFDVGIRDADATLTAPAKTCMRAMTAQGEDMTTSGSRGIALGVCDSAFALQAAVRGRGVSLAGYLGGLTALGRGYVSTLTLGTDFRGGRRDGAAAVRPFSYDPSCRCFHYTGAAFRP